LFLNRFYILNYKTQVISSDVTDKDIYRLKQYNLDTRDANHYGCLVEIEDNHGEIELINLEKILVLINELTKSLNP
jgi:hypothetical protein